MKESTTTRVYRYGARPGCDGIRDQMRLGHQYYNQLVEAENARRAQAWGAESPPPPPHPKAKDEANCKCAECKAHWKTLRDRYRAIPPLDLKPLRKVAVEGGLYFGTYLLIEQAFSAAWKKTRPLHRVRFKSWRKGAVAGVQIQKSYQDHGRTNTLYVLERAPDPRKGRRAKNGLGRATVKIRIGSDEQRRPMFSEPLRIEQHRPLEGVVTWVQVVLRYVADREVWSINFVCTNVSKRTDSTREGIVAVDVSWRKLSDGSWRLGWARDDRGNESQLLMSERWAECAKRADEIRQVRDKRLLALKAIDARFANIRSPRGVARLARKLDSPGEHVLAWLRRDRHLWQYEVGCRRRSHAGRRAELQKWARKLRHQYAIVVLKDSSHKQMKEGEKKKQLHKPARRQGHHAAPGETVEVLCRVFGRDEGVALVSAVHSTNECPRCGHTNDHGPERVIVCESCGDERDRDEVSTRNMLKRYAVGEYWKPTARKTAARFMKRHKNGEQRRNASPAA